MDRWKEMELWEVEFYLPLKDPWYWVVFHHVSPKSWFTFGVALKNVILMTVRLFIKKEKFKHSELWLFCVGCVSNIRHRFLGIGRVEC